MNRTFVEIPDDGLLLQEVLTELLTEAKLQHVVCEGTENTHINQSYGFEDRVRLEKVTKSNLTSK